VIETMRIGIDARFLFVAGPGRYEKNLIEQLEKLDKNNEYFIFLRKENFEKYQPQNRNFQKVLADYPWYSFKEQLFLPLKILRIKVDLMHFPHFNIPLFYFGPYVLTIHDLIMHEFSTERASTRSKPYYRFKRIVYKIVVKWAIRQAKMILVPSKVTKFDLMKRLNVSDKKVVVTYEGVDRKFNVQPRSRTSSLRGKSSKCKVEEDVLGKYGIRRPYLLYLGSMYPHKNVERLLQAFKILKETYNFSGQLVLVGKRDFFSKRVYGETEALDLKRDVVFPGLMRDDGYVSDDEVVVLLKESSVFVFPSLKEGFGLPPLEAMSLGVPVVASNISSIPEICQDAAHYFDPKDPEDMALKINELFADNTLRDDLISKGEKQASRYSWRTTAEQTLSVYKSLEIRD